MVTEGTVTEPAYIELLFQELRSELRAAVQVKTVAVGKDPVKVVRAARQHLEAAENAGRPFDWACCLVDVDRHASLRSALTEAADDGIHVVASNLKFEVWLLWHVEDGRAARTGPQLDQRATATGIMRGKALAADFPAAAYRRASEAARRADLELADRRIGPDPSSAMPVLIDLITGRAS